MNNLKVSVDKVSIVQPDFEYLSVIEGDAWIEYNEQKFWLDFVFDGEQLFYTDLKDKLGLVPYARDFDNEDDFYEAYEEAINLFIDIDSIVFDSIINELVDNYPALIAELKQKRKEQEEVSDEL